MKCKSKDEIFHNKCKFCGKDLNPIGLDYLYANIPLSSIEYERCDCKESKAYWNKIDLKEEKQKKRKHFEQMIKQFYIQNYSSKRIQDYQFENLIITETNRKEIEKAIDFLVTNAKTTVKKIETKHDHEHHGTETKKAEKKTTKTEKK